MQPATIFCSRCQSPLPAALFNQPDLTDCPACQSQIQVVTFPAYSHQPAPGSPAEPILTEEEASCFYHPEKRAVVPCHRCGRFLCGLCEVILNQEHLCPACLESAQQKGTLAALDHRRLLYDRLALLVALLPILFMWPATVLTGPLAVGLGIYSLKMPTGIVDRSRFRAYLAILFGLLETGGWLFIGISLFS